MLALDFVNNDIAPYLFIKNKGHEFIILALYVDDINLFGTEAITRQTIETLKGVFEMKYLGKPNYCLGLQFDYLTHDIFISQTTYTTKILKQFNMKRAYLVSTLMELQSTDKSKDIFRKRLDVEPLLGPEKPYLLAIGALLYLANQTRPDISFAVS